MLEKQVGLKLIMSQFIGSPEVTTYRDQASGNLMLLNTSDMTKLVESEILSGLNKIKYKISKNKSGEEIIILDTSYSADSNVPYEAPVLRLVGVETNPGPHNERRKVKKPARSGVRKNQVEKSKRKGREEEMGNKDAEYEMQNPNRLCALQTRFDIGDSDSSVSANNSFVGWTPPSSTSHKDTGINPNKARSTGEEIPKMQKEEPSMRQKSERKVNDFIALQMTDNLQSSKTNCNTMEMEPERYWFIDKLPSAKLYKRWVHTTWAYVSAFIVLASLLALLILYLTSGFSWKATAFFAAACILDFLLGISPYSLLPQEYVGLMYELKPLNEVKEFSSDMRGLDTSQYYGETVKYCTVCKLRKFEMVTHPVLFKGRTVLSEPKTLYIKDPLSYGFVEVKLLEKKIVWVDLKVVSVARRADTTIRETFRDYLDHALPQPKRVQQANTHADVFQYDYWAAEVAAFLNRENAFNVMDGAHFC